MAAAAVALALTNAPQLPAARAGDVTPAELQLGYSTSRIVVRFTPQALLPTPKPNRFAFKRNAAPPVVMRAPGAPVGVSDRLKAEANAWGVTELRPLCRNKPKNAQVAQAFGFDRTYVIDVPPGTDTAAMVASFAALGEDIEAVDVDAIGTVAELIPDDPEFPNQYAMHNTGQIVNGRQGIADADIDAPEAWSLHTGGLGTTTIAIVDTGVHPHPDFAERLLPGINTTTNPFSTDTSDSCPHGTFVAGVAAATGNNGIGIAGVNWGTNILPVRVWNGCVGGAADVAEGIMWAVDNGADVINVSLQFCFDSQNLIKNAVDYAAAQGVLVFAAAGNNNSGCFPLVTIPARYANSVAVSATNMLDGFASFSSSGSEIDVAAPGDNIRSTSVQFFCENGTNNGSLCTSNLNCFGGGTCTGRMSTYAFSSGTSFASPCVAGLAVLIKSFAPSVTAADIRTILQSSADDLGTAGLDTQFGHGRINAHEALVYALLHAPPWIMSSDPPTGSLDARQPSEPDGTAEAGWQWLDVIFGGDTSAGFALADFEITDDSGVLPAPIVLAVLSKAPDPGYKLVFNRKIAVAARTTVRHLDSNTTVLLSWLPGDTDGSGVAEETDLLTLFDALTGTVAALPNHASDIDRSGLAAPADLLREIDLLNGAGVYATLPTTLP